MNKKFGFTLAEVLITLAIIGVVAALTIPTLVTNYQKREWATKLIKAHAELTQGFKMMMAQDNTSSLSQTKGWLSMNVDNCNWQTLGTDSCKAFVENLFSFISGNSIDVAGDYKINYLNLSNDYENWEGRYIVSLKNGVKLMAGFYKIPRASSYQDLVNSSNISMKNVLGYIYMDVNGYKKPNTLGRDVFEFYFSDNGNIYPVGGRDLAVFFNGDANLTWDKNSTKWYNCSSTELSQGFACTARVLETGKMDY